MSTLKPITLYAHAGPNPWKTVIILEELKIPYEMKFLEFSDMKKPPFSTEINPNGRVPAITDPNTNLTLWESGAIAHYLISTYDTHTHSISYPASTPEFHLCNQWLHFQVSGQGPYFGQAGWFQRYHPEKLPSAVDRYINEIERVVAVLDAHLKKQEGGYLVGDKCTYADLAFVVWNVLIPKITKSIDTKGKYPSYEAWMERMKGREAVKKALEENERAQANK